MPSDGFDALVGPGSMECGAGVPLHADALRRLRWRARRGLLENDLLVSRFLERYAHGLAAAEADAFSRLMDLPEAELLDLLLGRVPLAPSLDGPAMRGVLVQLQSV